MGLFFSLFNFRVQESPCTLKQKMIMCCNAEELLQYAYLSYMKEIGRAHV